MPQTGRFAKILLSSICWILYTKERPNMKLNAPKTITWWVALILGVIGLIGSFVSIPVVSSIAFWLVVVGLALLLVANAVSGL